MNKLTFQELPDNIDELNDEELKDILDRLDFNSIPTYPIFKVNRFSFDVDDELLMTAEFSIPIDSEEYCSFNYKVNGNEFQEKVVPYSIYSRILATLSNIIQEFIRENEPKSIFLKSNPRIKGTEDRSKHRIHGQCLKMQIYKIPEYDYKELEDGWLIYKKEI